MAREISVRDSPVWCSSMDRRVTVVPGTRHYTRTSFFPCAVPQRLSSSTHALCTTRSSEDDRDFLLPTRSGSHNQLLVAGPLHNGAARRLVMNPIFVEDSPAALLPAALLPAALQSTDSLPTDSLTTSTASSTSRLEGEESLVFDNEDSISINDEQESDRSNDQIVNHHRRIVHSNDRPRETLPYEQRKDISRSDIINDNVDKGISDSVSNNHRRAVNEQEQSIYDAGGGHLPPFLAVFATTRSPFRNMSQTRVHPSEASSDSSVTTPRPARYPAAGRHRRASGGRGAGGGGAGRSHAAPTDRDSSTDVTVLPSTSSDASDATSDRRSVSFIAGTLDNENRNRRVPRHNRNRKSVAPRPVPSQVPPVDDDDDVKRDPAARGDSAGRHRMSDPRMTREPEETRRGQRKAARERGGDRPRSNSRRRDEPFQIEDETKDNWGVNQTKNKDRQADNMEINQQRKHKHHNEHSPGHRSPSKNRSRSPEKESKDRPERIKRSQRTDQQQVKLSNDSYDRMIRGVVKRTRRKRIRNMSIIIVISFLILGVGSFLTVYFIMKRDEERAADLTTTSTPQ